MKILILTDIYPVKNALNNGVFIHQQVKALQEMGVECHVLLLHNWYPPFGLHRLHTYWQQGYDLRQQFFEQYEQVMIHAVPMFVRMPGRLFKENHYERAGRTLTQYIKRNKAVNNADWLYAHFLTNSGYIGATIKDALHMKLAAMARGDDVHAWPEEQPELVNNLQVVFEKADLLLANSGKLAADTCKWMMQGKERQVSVVYNGVDNKRFRPAVSAAEKQDIARKYSFPEGEKYILCVATPVLLKGWIELLEAVKVCGDEFNGWTLIMITPNRSNSDVINLTQKGKELGIANKLLHLGAIAPANLAEVLRAADAFVLPSYNEGMSNALLEAMATGLACITTDVGGHSEVIKDGVNGLLVRPKTVKPLAEAISKVTGNEKLRLQMGKLARERMLAFGDYKDNSRKLMDLLAAAS